MQAFKRDMNLCSNASAIPAARTPHYSALLHNMVLAIGVSMWRGDSIQEEFHATRLKLDHLHRGEDSLAEIAADAFFQRAQQFFEIEAERPMQSTVNGLLLMASFSSGRAKPNLGRKSCPLTPVLTKVSVSNSFNYVCRCILQLRRHNMQDRKSQIVHFYIS